MFSLVNYGNSDSENEISDEEEETPAHQNGAIIDDDITETVSKIRLQLPAPVAAFKKAVEIEEEDDEFLHKKAIPTVAPPPPPKQKVKIVIPKMSSFKDVDEDREPKIKAPTATNKKLGLLGMLPRPAHTFGPAVKATVSEKPTFAPSSSSGIPSTASTSTIAKTDAPPKKVGLIPYALMEHKKKADLLKAKKVEESDSDDDGDGDGNSFFSFATKDENLPKVSEEEIQALVDKQTEKLEQRKRQHEDSEKIQQAEQSYDLYQQQQQEMDHEAMKALLGGNRAKRNKLDDIQIIDLSADQVLPDRDEWVRRSLAGETSYMATGKMVEKVS